MAARIGASGHFSVGGSVGSITLSTVETSGRLHLIVTANDATAPTVSSSSLGSWGSPRAQITGSTGIYEWTIPFSSKLTNEIISYVGFTGGFTTMDVVEVNGVTAFDGSAVTSPTAPFSVDTTNPTDILIAAFRLTASSTSADPGWTVISNADFQLVEYLLVGTPQASRSIGTGGNINGAIADFVQAAVARPTDIILAAGAVNPADIWLYPPRTILAAEAGSFALTGTAASVLHQWRPTADAGSYALTGSAATLRRNLPLVAGAGSYALTGTSASLLHQWTLSAGAGVYALTGTAAALNKGQRLTAGGGSYALTGTDASLLHSWKLAALAGSYALTGTAATLRRNLPLIAGAGSYSLTGTAAALYHKWVVAAGAGSYALTGTAAAFLRSDTVHADAGAYALTGTAAAVLHAWAVAAGAGSYTLTGSDASLVKLTSKTLNADSGSYSLTGSAAALSHRRVLTAGGGSFALSGAAATLDAAGNVDGPPIVTQPPAVIGGGGVIGSPQQPRVPQYRIVGKGDGRLPSFGGAAAGFIPRIEGAAVATLSSLFVAEAVGTIPNFGEASAQVGLIKAGARGTVKFLHDDEEMLILMLAA